MDNVLCVTFHVSVSQAMFGNENSAGGFAGEKVGGRSVMVAIFDSVEAYHLQWQYSRDYMATLIVECERNVDLS